MSSREEIADRRGRAGHTFIILASNLASEDELNRAFRSYCGLSEILCDQFGYDRGSASVENDNLRRLGRIYCTMRMLEVEARARGAAAARKLLEATLHAGHLDDVESAVISEASRASLKN